MSETTWQGGRPTTPRMHEVAERVADVEALDAPAETLSGAFSSAVGPGPLKDALSGTWLGHALHPLLTDATIAFFLSASTLDLIGGRESDAAARRLIAAGLASSLPTAVTGLNDWTDTVRSDAGARRVGMAHAMANGAATVLYGASLLARRAGARRLGAALGLAGLGALSVGGHLGGHLTYSQGVGVDQTTFEEPPREWTRVLADADLAEGAAAGGDADGVDVLLVRQGGRVYALANRCTHRGGPLHQGRLSDGCVECPWHKSVFRLDDGSVERGPAAYPQRSFDVRVADGEIFVRAR
ncbi:MAG TPA: Rieske (2Fe-2S) protein [Gaiellaceae bacterium]|nr:Rieske (2Fe-2S) protein [Gaiellaceae bacterium]